MNLVERITILRGVSLFTELSERDLAEVAKLLEEVRLPANATLFEQGERGYSMYIIVSGRVKVHDGERILNYLGKRDVFGEMAALATEPRIASVTAVEDTLLLQLFQRPLHKLMVEQEKVMRGVIHVLCRHLRARVRDLAEERGFHHDVAYLSEIIRANLMGNYDIQALYGVTLRADELGELAQLIRQLLDDRRDLRPASGIANSPL